MDFRPRKPDRSITQRIKELDRAVATSRKTKADTKALSSASKELQSADKALDSAMTEFHSVCTDAYDKTCAMLKPSPGGVPVPYPVIAKSEKSAKEAVGKLRKVQKKHDKVCTKARRLIDKEVKGLEPAARSGGDEAATLKGLISARSALDTRIKLGAAMVMIEGKNVVRHFDMVTRNAKK
ncbi:MAG: DUF4150 domain-containing protein [Roseivivax sp.]|nr:DUF4150 domain-containing protein [Roseivivax sp.]